MNIVIDRLVLRAFHGVMEQERIVGNEFEVSLNLGLSALCDEGAADDLLDKTVNYASVIRVVKQQMAIPSKLIENVAWRIARAILDEFPMVEGGEVKVTKVTPPCGVKVEGVSVVYRF